jgi:prepilin-type N-terminal cleavage/methylation domain-containing protein
MSPTLTEHPTATCSSQAGFSIAELLVSLAVLAMILSAVTGGLLQLSTSQRMIWNRTEMHSSVRGATELLQQEVGQAGLVSTPAPVTLSAAVGSGSQTVNVSSAASLFVGEQVLVDAGDSQEPVTLTAVDTSNNQISGTFMFAHSSGAVLGMSGGFNTGVVPPTITNGSTGSVLKLYGDINGDGNMVYVEYTCDTGARRLYRNVVAWNATSKPALAPSLVLLNNIVANPSGTPCFTYQTAIVNGNPYVLDVAITLTVRTGQKDPITKQYQTETKTLLNVSPRNVFNVWELASIGVAARVQPMPASILTLIQ